MCRLKKLLCVIFSIVFFLSACIYTFAESAQFNDNEISAEKFASAVSGMINAEEELKDLPGRDRSSEENDFKTSRLIVKSKYKINTYNASTSISGFNDLWVLQYSSPAEAEKAFEYYSKQKNVEFVEPDKEIFALSNETNNYPYNNISDDSEYLSWGPEHIGIDILNKQLTDDGTALNQTIVAVIDSGVDHEHPFLQGRVLPTRINTSSSGTRNSSMDDNGHGTQVAGVIADCSLSNIYIQPYKVLDSKGRGTLISLAAGINCAVNDKVDVINISIGFEEESDILKSAIDNAEMNDILVISAAGNNGLDTLYYPASYKNVVKVSAINESNILTNFSTYGNGVDFAAPGIRIKTTTLGGNYITAKGTSIAAPFVSSIAAVIRAVIPDSSIEDILNIMSDSAILVNEHSPELKYGNGIIHAPQSPIDYELKEKTSTPYFSHKTAFSLTELDIHIFCDTADAEIYYTTDRSVPSRSNPAAIKYDGTPIHASQTIAVMAVAYSEGRYRSSVSSFGSIIAPYAPENSLTVDFDGTLVEYTGNATSITVPETVNGITVTSIGERAFAEKNITEVILPDTVTEIKNEAFKDCTQLKTIFARKIKQIGNSAFENCIWIKNMFLMSELEHIGEYSFAYVGSKQYMVTGSTFELQLKKLKSIPEGAFRNSAISRAILGSLSSIEKNAFSECNQLVNIFIESIPNLSDGCFKGCKSLVDAEIKGITYIPASAFNSCENLMVINFPDARNINSNAFENCVSLVEVNLPSAVTVYSNAFNGCQKLKTLNLPSMKFFEPELYNQNSYSPLLPENLEVFYAPSMEKTVADMFRTSPYITNIRLSGAKEFSENTFRGCYNIYSLMIESAETINKGTFNDCKIEYIDARNLITTADMPENSGILLSNNFLESTDKSESLTVYGTPGTFVERYSKLKGYNFVEIPLVYKPVPQYITENSETIYVIAVGFDLTYQWYWNTVSSTTGGTPIEGATEMSYTFTENDTAPFYYCEITQNDLGTISKITTDVITKDTVPADYTAYNEAVKKASEIDRAVYLSTAELDRALSVDVSDRYSCEQDFVDAQTKAIYDAISSLKLKVIDSVDVFASETRLTLFEETRIITVLNPKDVQYKDIEYISENERIVVVFSNGYVWCVGSGSADVIVRITNLDDSVVEGKITFESKLSFIEDFIATLLRSFFIIASRISNIFK